MMKSNTDPFNFDLMIVKHDNRYRARVIQGPAGEEGHDFVLSFNEQELKLFLQLPTCLYRQLCLDPHSISNLKAVDPKSFGTRLFRSVFAEGIHTSLMRSIDAAQRQNTLLRIRLRLNEVPELSMLPWEYLFNPTNEQFLVLSTDIALIRYMDLPTENRPLEVIPPLRVLVLISNPKDAPYLDVEQEWVQLQETFQNLITSNKLLLTRVPVATRKSLRQELNMAKYHIFHFIGHGWFDEQTEMSGLVFEDDHGYSSPINGQQLGVLLEEYPTLRLAFLNACQGAKSSSGVAFSSTAHRLVQHKLPAVIAMQFPITDANAILLAYEFYRALAEYYPIDQALTEARRTVYIERNSMEWSTPVLFMRSLNGHIFSSSNTLPAPIVDTHPANQEQPNLISTLSLPVAPLEEPKPIFLPINYASTIYIDESWWKDSASAQAIHPTYTNFCIYCSTSGKTQKLKKIVTKHNFTVNVQANEIFVEEQMDKESNKFKVVISLAETVKLSSLDVDWVFTRYHANSVVRLESNGLEHITITFDPKSIQEAVLIKRKRIDSRFKDDHYLLVFYKH